MRRAAKGFTLIEVIVALTILMGAIIILGNSWSGNLLKIRKANLYNNAALLLERKMVEIENQYRDKPLSELPEEASGDFGEEFPKYRWKLVSKKFVMPDMSALLTNRKQGADDTLIGMIKQVNDFISNAVKEVVVSVQVKTGERQAEYSVTTYFIEYGADTLPGAIPGLPAGAGAGPGAGTVGGSPTGQGPNPAAPAAPSPGSGGP